MSVASAAPGGAPAHVRVRLSREGRTELRALGRSVAGHLVALLALVAMDWLHRVPFRQPPPAIRVGLAPASALPRASRGAPPAPRPASRPPAPAPPPAAPAPEPPEDLPGIAPRPEPETPAAPEREPEPPKRRPRPERASAPSPSPSTSSAPSASPSTAPAASDAAAPGLVAAGIAATVDGWEGGPGDPYLGGIVQRVSSKWLKPRTGLPSSGTLVFFEIDRGGAVRGVRLERPSGSSLYDRAALRAVELAAPLPPLPAGVKGASLKVHFEFLP